MPQFGASLSDDYRSIIYNCNVFIIQATGGNGCIRTHDLENLSHVFYHCALGKVKLTRLNAGLIFQLKNWLHE
jgi:hypothetical protein